MAKKKKEINDNLIKEQLNLVKTELKDGIFIFTGPMSISEFANKTNLNPIEIITGFLKKNKMYNLNQILTEEEIAELCFDNDFDFQKKDEINESNFMEHIEIKDDAKDLKIKAPVVTIMGHVDHGKTTLIDFIRQSSITKKESGGITQHTGAYQVKHKKSFITFLDTPGHEAFTNMRSRGAKITNLVVLVVAADDGVMPQTIEAINHAKAAQTPIIVFVNKMDKHDADPKKVKNNLSKYEIISEEWGGSHQFIYGSGLTGQGVDKLFETILLEAEMLNLKANPNRDAIGYVVESRIDKGKGVIATLIVENGTLHKRDFIVAGSNYGKIRSLENSNQEEIKEATPGMPIIVTGLNYSPNAGDKFVCFRDEKFAKDLASKKSFSDKMKNLNEINSSKNVDQDKKTINLIIKSDTQGTLEALKHALLNLSTDDIQISIVHFAIGPITKSDLLLAKTTNSVVYSFNLKTDQKVINEAKLDKIIIKNKFVIYEIIEDVQLLIQKVEGPKFETFVSGKAIIQKIFFYSKVGNIAGCLMTDGYVKFGSEVNVYRNDKNIFNGRIDSLQREKNQTKEVKKGSEFGTHIKNFNDIQEDDVLEFMDKKEII